MSFEIVEIVPPESGDSILTSTKKLLGIEEDYTHFDLDILTHINSAFTTLYQLGIGTVTEVEGVTTVEPFSIVDSTTVWSDLFGERKDLELVKTYIYLKVRLVFDPPQTGYLVEALKSQLLECEWRLNDWTITIEETDDEDS